MDKFTILIVNVNGEMTSVETDSDNFTSDIVLGIGEKLCQKHPIHTNIIHEERDRIWQITHVESNDEKQINHFISGLTPNKKTIYENVILFCSKVNDIGSCETLSVTEADAKQLAYLKTHHVGIRIEDNTISEFKFEELSISSEVYEYFPTVLFGFDLEIYVKKKFETKKVNKFASSLVKKRVYDDVYIVHKIGEYSYGDIDLKLINDLKSLYHTPIDLQVITDDDMKHEKDSRNLTIVKNRWWMLRKKLNEFRNKIGKCWCCNKYTKLICGGCYRLHYCTTTCQEQDWENHKNDCLKMK